MGQTKSLSLDPEKAITQYRLTSWTTLDGLPQNTVNAVEQSHDGYVWLATQEGLVRFDGLVFSLFDRKNTDAFEVSTVNHLLEGADSTLWIGTRGGGVISYKDGVFTPVEGTSSPYSTALYEDLDGSIWYGTFKGGVNRIFAGHVSVFDDSTGLAGRVVSLVTRTAGGTLMVATDAGVFTLSQGSFAPTPDPLLRDAYLTAYFVDSAGREWIGLRDGSFFLREGDRAQDLGHLTVGEGTYIKSVVEDTSGSIWLGLRGAGLLRYARGSFERFGEQHGLSSDVVLSLLEDREGGLWAGTSNGLNRFQDGKFTTYTASEGLSHDDAKSVYVDGQGAVWVATKGGGVNRIQGRAVTHIGADDGLSSDDAQAIVGMSDGTIWVGTSESGLNRIGSRGIDVFSTRNGLSGDQVYALYVDARQRVWVGTEGGVSIIDGREITNITPDDGLSSPFVTDFAEHPSGDMWIATYDGGINRYSNGLLTTLTTEDGLYSDAILAIESDPDGTLWIGTYGEGLNVLRESEVGGVIARKGLADDTIFSIMADDHGHMWFSSNKGLFSASRDALLAASFGMASTIASTLYGVSDGLKTAEANGGQQPASWKGPKGDLWFPMAHGVASIDPGHLRLNLVEPPIAIEAFFIDSEPVAFNRNATVSLAPGSERLEFDYTAMSFPAPEKVMFEVRLEGYEDTWQPVGSRRETFYTNLDPGFYAFHVRARNGDGVWSSKGASVSFILRPYFYETRWFMMVSMLMVLALAAVAYRLRIAQLKARERELERTVEERTHDLRIEKENVERARDVIAEQAEELKELDGFKTKFYSNVSHEFRTPLTMLIGPLENALEGTYGDLTEPMRHQSTIMLRNARRLMRLINQLLDLSKLEAGRMQLQARKSEIVQFVREMTNTFTAFAQKKQLVLSFESSAAELDVYFEPDKIEKVFFNLLSNAAKFTPTEGRIDVRIGTAEPTPEMPAGAVIISVEDSGQGIPAEDLPLIFDRFKQAKGTSSADQESTGIGLALVQELVHLHHGTIHVTSEVGRGSTFTVSLPMGTQHLADDEMGPTSDANAGPAGDGSAVEDLAHIELSSKHLHQDIDGSGSYSADVDRLEPATRTETILVVEDNRDVREYVAAILAGEFNVLEAVDGLDGWEKVQLTAPDLVISDVTMPRMDGNELCERIKTHAAHNHIPVLLLTARASLERKLEGLGKGADDYMAKPFNARELLVRARNLIRLHRQDKELKALNESLEAQVQEQLDVILSEREQYENQLIVARDRAETSSRMKSAILDNINHEFRTPLTTILGYSRILVEEAPEALKEFAATIETGGNRLLRTLNGVIELANIEASFGESDDVDENVVLEAEEVVLSYRDAAAAKGLRLGFNVDLSTHDPRASIRTQPRVLQRVLDALVDNAIKFTSVGDVVVSIHATRGMLSVSVRDSGEGIPESLQSTIFDAFVQGNDGLTRSHEGCGVGLSVAHRLCDQVGWALSVVSTEGEGTMFTVSIRANNTDDSAIKNRHDSRQRGISEKSTGAV